MSIKEIKISKLGHILFVLTTTGLTLIRTVVSVLLRQQNSVLLFLWWVFFFFVVPKSLHPLVVCKVHKVQKVNKMWCHLRSEFLE